MIKMRCAHCGAGSEKTLKKCMRCLSVAYCNHACQKAHWKQHKKVCRQSIRPPNVGPVSLPSAPSREMRPNYGIRHVTLKPVPSDAIRGCCALCSMYVLHGDKESTACHWLPDPFASKSTRQGVYPIEYYFKRWTYKGDLGMLRRDDGAIGVCSFCADIMQRGSAKVRERHMEDCFAIMTRETPMKAFPPMFHEMTTMEKRLLRQIDLLANPDLSKGPASIAGKFKGETKQKVPFAFQKLELLAFPTLLNPSAVWKEGSTISLHHYMLARLYSPIDVYRNDMDYVVFSLFRGAAYGIPQITEDLLQSLPPIISDEASLGKVGVISLAPFESTM